MAAEAARIPRPLTTTATRTLPCPSRSRPRFRRPRTRPAVRPGRARHPRSRRTIAPTTGAPAATNRPSAFPAVRAGCVSRNRVGLHPPSSKSRPTCSDTPCAAAGCGAAMIAASSSGRAPLTDTDQVPDEVEAVTIAARVERRVHHRGARLAARGCRRCSSGTSNIGPRHVSISLHAHGPVRSKTSTRPSCPIPHRNPGSRASQRTRLRAAATRNIAPRRRMQLDSRPRAVPTAIDESSHSSASSSISSIWPRCPERFRRPRQTLPATRRNHPQQAQPEDQRHQDPSDRTNHTENNGEACFGSHPRGDDLHPRRAETNSPAPWNGIHSRPKARRKNQIRTLGSTSLPAPRPPLDERAGPEHDAEGEGQRRAEHR